MVKPLIYVVIIVSFICAFTITRENDLEKVNNIKKTEKRFFSDDSFWNTPIEKNAEVDPRSEEWINILKNDPSGPFFGVNTEKYTIPVYEADENTPRFKIYNRPVEENFRAVHGHNNGWFDKNKYYGHGPGFGEQVPIPLEAQNDPEEDAHMVVVDWKNNTVWDMWGAKKIDGKWHSFTGMKYDAKGSGDFSKLKFNISDGQSIHFFGPGRAAGVPVVAGLVLYDEVMAGQLNHKVACATRYNAYKEYVFPATWSDGCKKGGPPEGAVIQLNPNLDLSQFQLTPEEKLLAKALQVYGMVIVDQAGANVIYAQGLYASKDKSWKDKIRGWEAGLISIPISNYRILKVKDVKKGGLNSEELNSRYFKVVN